MTAERSWCRRPQGLAVPCDSPTAMPRAWTGGGSRSEAFSSQGPRASFFLRATTRVTPSRSLAAPSASFLVSIMAPRGNLPPRPRGTRSLGNAAPGRKAANRSLHPCSVRRTESRTDLASHGSADCWFLLRRLVQGMSMINRTAIENDLLSNCHGRFRRLRQENVCARSRRFRPANGALAVVTQRRCERFSREI